MTVKPVLWVRGPLLPVIVIPYRPVRREEEANTLITEFAEPPAVGVTGFVAKLIVRPVGRPDAIKETGDENPFIEATVMVLDVVLPCGMFTLAGVTMSVKSGAGPGATTWRVNDAE